MASRVNPGARRQYVRIRPDNSEQVSSRRSKEGKPFTVRYDQVNAMLLNEFLKEHRKVQEWEANHAQQKAIQAFTAMVKEQAAQIQKVSALVELNNPRLRTVSR